MKKHTLLKQYIIHNFWVLEVNYTFNKVHSKIGLLEYRDFSLHFLLNQITVLFKLLLFPILLNPIDSYYSSLKK